MNWKSLLGLDAWTARYRSCLTEGAIAVEDRIALLGLEWAAYKKRMRTTLVLCAAAAAVTVIMLLMLSLAVVVHFWDTPQRVVVTWVVAGVWTFVWAIVLSLLAAALRTIRNPFALTRHELARDWKAWKETM